MPHLAHVAHPIEHQSHTYETILGFAGLVAGVYVATGTLVGAVVAAVPESATIVGIVVAAATIAAAVSAWAGTVTSIAEVGRMFGKRFDGDTRVVEGAIVTGARTVFVGADILNAANACAKTRVDCHRAYVSQGSRTVHIEGHNASRKGDGTSCDGEIARGCESVEVGGSKVGDTGTDPGDIWYQLLTGALTPLDFVATWVPGGKGWKDRVMWLLGISAELTDEKGLKDALSINGAKEGVQEWAKKKYGGPKRR